VFNKIITIFLLVAGFAVSVYPQKLPITVYGAADGLPPYSVEGMLQDHLGNMWFTTQGGLVRFNGKRFMHFTSEHGLAHDFCRPIIEDRNHVLWVGTLGGGLTRVVRNDFGGYEFRVYEAADGLNDNSVLALAADSGGLWIGTKQGLCRMHIQAGTDSAVWEYFLSGKVINNVLIAGDGTVWCGDMSGFLYHIRRNQCDTIGMFDDYSAGISGIIETGAGEYRVASFNNGAGFLRVRGERYAVDTARSGFVYLSRRIFGLYRDRRNRILAATRGDGLLIADGEKIQRITIENGLPENQIACVYQDRQNSVWMAPMSGGLCKWTDFPAVHFDEDTGLPDNNVLSILQDHSGRYWAVCHEKGLSFYDGARWQTYRTQHGLPTNSLYTIFEDSHKNLWISSFGMGLVRFDGKRFIRFMADQIRLNDVQCIFEDSRGQMWFGTDVDGVIRYGKNGKLDVFNLNHGLAGQRVLAIYEDRRGNLWFGCAQPSRMKEAGGVSFISAKNKTEDAPVIENFNKRSGLKSRYVSSILETSDGALWLATRTHGLVKYFHDSLKYFMQRDGLPSNTISGLAEDSTHRLWIATLKGLAVMEGDSFRLITHDHGLFDDAVNENAFRCDREGALWLGTPTGLTVYRHRPNQADASAPTVYIEQIRMKDQWLAVSALSRLSYDQNDLAFEVTGIDFRYRRGLMYQFYLDGFDYEYRNWSERDYISYTNLDPGAYVLRIRARNIYGAVSREYQWPIHIRPAVWQTWWFRLAATVTLIILLPVLYRRGSSVWNRFQQWRRRHWIAHYKILAPLGEGAMGIVYRARDRSNGKEVALKVIHPKALSEPDIRVRFERESQILATLDHPNIVKVFAAGYWQGTGYIAMEWLTGGSLKARIQKQTGMEQCCLRDIAVSVASGLAYMHRKGIIHRDLKSDNIMLDENGVPKIMDFGLSKSALMTGLTQTGTAIGTLGYVAPEQVSGLTTDARSDMFSFGVVLYEMVTGRLPFRGDNEIALIHSIFTDAPPRPSTVVTDCPPDLETVIMRCLEKDPERRYQDMNAVVAELQK